MQPCVLLFFLVMVRKSCLRSRVEEKILLPQFDKVPVEPECSGRDKEAQEGVTQVQFHLLSVDKPRCMFIGWEGQERSKVCNSFIG